jgi:hypothetical protein
MRLLSRWLVKHEWRPRIKVNLPNLACGFAGPALYGWAKPQARKLLFFSSGGMV